MTRLALVLLSIATLGLGACSSNTLPEDDFDTMQVRDQFSAALDEVSGALGSISDVESAQAALPALQTADERLGDVMSQYLDQTTETQQFMTNAAGELVPPIASMVDSVNSIPGVSDVIGSTTTSIMGKLHRFL